MSAVDLNSFSQTLYDNLVNTSVLELVAVFFGLLSVWYAKKVNILVYPTGIISVLIYVNICFNSQLYADMGINAFYFVMSVYGWIMWTRKGENHKERPVSFCRGKCFLVTAVFFAASLVIILLLLTYFKSDDDAYWATGVPYIDTFTTAIFIVAMGQMALKKVESWIFWIVGDVISVPLYFYKGLVFTSLQFTIFLVIAVMGYLEWRKQALNLTNGA